MVTAEDGKVMGEALMILAKEKEKEGVIKAYIESNKAICGLASKYKFVEPMLISVLKNNLTPLVKVKSETERGAKRRADKTITSGMCSYPSSRRTQLLNHRNNSHPSSLSSSQEMSTS